MVVFSKTPDVRSPKRSSKDLKDQRWELLDSYGLREKFKDLLYAAAKTPDAKSRSKSNGSNDWIRIPAEDMHGFPKDAS